MSPPLRVVIDPNVYISAALTAGVSRRLVELAADGAFVAVASPTLLAELADVLGRPRFERWRSRADVKRFVDDISAMVELVPDAEVVAGVTRDPGDDYLAALASVIGADCICSGDRDLPKADVGAEVLRPNELVDKLNALQG